MKLPKYLIALAFVFFSILFVSFLVFFPLGFRHYLGVIKSVKSLPLKIQESALKIVNTEPNSTFVSGTVGLVTDSGFLLWTSNGPRYLKHGDGAVYSYFYFCHKENKFLPAGDSSFRINRSISGNYKEWVRSVKPGDFVSSQVFEGTGMVHTIREAQSSDVLGFLPFKFEEMCPNE